MKATLLTLALLLTASGCPQENPQKPAPSKKLQEDDPQWDCRTMGDKHCGPSDRRRL
jgi:hypothetical protein